VASVAPSQQQAMAWRRATAQDDDVITASVKRPGKNRPDLSGSSWNDDLHDSLLGS
jgi:hypothetical protein